MYCVYGCNGKRIFQKIDMAHEMVKFVWLISLSGNSSRFVEKVSKLHELYWILVRICPCFEPPFVKWPLGSINFLSTKVTLQTTSIQFPFKHIVASQLSWHFSSSNPIKVKNHSGISCIHNFHGSTLLNNIDYAIFETQMTIIAIFMQFKIMRLNKGINYSTVIEQIRITYLGKIIRIVELSSRHLIEWADNKLALVGTQVWM